MASSHLRRNSSDISGSTLGFASFTLFWSMSCGDDIRGGRKPGLVDMADGEEGGVEPAVEPDFDRTRWRFESPRNTEPILAIELQREDESWESQQLWAIH